MFALLCLFAGIIFTTCAYGAWEYGVKGYWVWAAVATGSFVQYANLIHS